MIKEKAIYVFNKLIFPFPPPLHLTENIEQNIVSTFVCISTSSTKL